MKKSIGISPNIEAFFGTRDENVRLLEDGLNITINLRSNAIELEGAARDVARVEQVFADYETLQRAGHTFNNGDLNSMLRVLASDPNTTLRSLADAGRQRSFGRRTVQPKSSNQRRYLQAIEGHDMVFGIGPAGIRKTYLAGAMGRVALLARRGHPHMRWKRARCWGFCQARCKTRSILTCGRSMTLCMTCSIPRRWIAIWRRTSSRSLPSLSCAGALC